MEIVGVGVEIVECLRVGRLIEQHGELVLGRVYTAREMRFCQARKRALEHFAAHWAGKEAVLKALGTPWRRGIDWTDLEIRQEPGAAVQVLLCGATKDVAQGLSVSNIFLSLAHTRAYATAYAIAVRG